MIQENSTITGVQIKSLKTNSDERGFFREVVRVSDPFFEGEPFAQWSHSRMIKNVVKAWHYHHVQIDWWYVPIGRIMTVLFDNREESPTYKTKMEFEMGEEAPLCVKILPGVLHGCKVLSAEAHLMYITSVTYNANEEGRFPYNSSLVGQNWGDNVIVTDNDKRTFVPTSIRKMI